ncbi:MAG: hypothetical protein PHY92_04445 [Alphaproteobacteria bacterium]|nr:hypothetical protein [Alphaproteobacteria bacterium]
MFEETNPVADAERRARCETLAAPTAGLTDAELLREMIDASAALVKGCAVETFFDFRKILEAEESGQAFAPDAVKPQVLKNFHLSKQFLGALGAVMLRIRGQGYDNHPDLAGFEGINISADTFGVATLGVFRYLPNFPSEYAMRAILSCALAVQGHKFGPAPRGAVAGLAASSGPEQARHCSLA